MPTISFIIPIYNVEKYLTCCLESIISQNTDEIEIICINDGSTDNSLNILNSYQKKVANLKVINQINSGVSIARNRGLKEAKGEYIFFVDADDFLPEDAIGNILEQIKKINFDILVFAHNFISPQNETNNNLLDLELYLNKKELKYFIPFLYCIWDKVYKKEFLDKNHIKFIKDMKTAEDGIFNLHCLYNNPKIEFFNGICYNYRQLREGSATSNISIETEIKALKYSLKDILFRNANENYKVVTIEKYIKGILYWFNHPILATKKKANKKKLKKLYKELQKELGIDFLNKCYNIEEFKSNLKSKILKNIFSIKNEYSGNCKRKVIVLFGIKIKFKKGRAH